MPLTKNPLPLISTCKCLWYLIHIPVQCLLTINLHVCITREDRVHLSRKCTHETCFGLCRKDGGRESTYNDFKLTGIIEKICNFLCFKIFLTQFDFRNDNSLSSFGELLNQHVLLGNWKIVKSVMIVGFECFDVVFIFAANVTTTNIAYNISCFEMQFTRGIEKHTVKLFKRGIQKHTCQQCFPQNIK